MSEDVRRGHFGLAAATEPLSTEDVERLPEGAHVVVIWSGGNGPHEYVVAVDRHGRRYAARNDDPDDQLRWYNPLTFVGVERYHTRVWLAEHGQDSKGSDFGLREAPGEDAHVKLVRQQLATALMYADMEAVERLRSWLVTNGHGAPRAEGREG